MGYNIVQRLESRSPNLRAIEQTSNANRRDLNKSFRRCVQQADHSTIDLKAKSDDVVKNDFGKRYSSKLVLTWLNLNNLIL